MTAIPLVATEYITMTMEGGIRMPSAPDVVITPAPNCLGKPWLTMAGRMIDPMATTVAGDEPDTAANNAHAMTPARPSPPYQCPTIADAKRIMRLATPPWVRKLPARMKNGIAMISNFSMPVKSFSATAWIGTSVKVKRKISTVRPRAMDTGIAVSISAMSKKKMSATRTPELSGTMPYLPARQSAASAMGKPQIQSHDVVSEPGRRLEPICMVQAPLLVAC